MLSSAREDLLCLSLEPCSESVTNFVAPRLQNLHLPKSQWNLLAQNQHIPRLKSNRCRRVIRAAPCASPLVGSRVPRTICTSLCDIVTLRGPEPSNLKAHSFQCLASRRLPLFSTPPYPEAFLLPTCTFGDDVDRSVACPSFTHPQPWPDENPLPPHFVDISSASTPSVPGPHDRSACCRCKGSPGVHGTASLSPRRRWLRRCHQPSLQAASRCAMPCRQLSPSPGPC